MALINHVRSSDHAAEWRPVLEQFFNLVRTFNAHRATFEDRIELLRGFRELREEWRPRMDEAIATMRRDWADRTKRTAVILADHLSKSLTLIEKKDIGNDTRSEEERTREVKRAFENRLRRHELDCRAEIERLYRHTKLESDAGDAALLESSDLFSETSFRTFGLTTKQLTRYAAYWGAAIGGAIDLMVGGLSFFLGTAIGAAAGALSAYLLGDQVARSWNSKSKLARTLFPTETGEFLYMGPITNPRFAWILTDRALSHARAVRGRAHARQDPLQTERLAEESQPEMPGLVASLPASLRDPIDAQFRKLLEHATRGERVPHTVTETLAAALEKVLLEETS